MNIKKIWHKRRYHWGCGLFIIIFCVFVHISFIAPGTQRGEPLKRLEGLAYDLRLKSTLTMHPKREFLPIIIVDIDEKSIKKIGRFPWSRSIMAKLHSELVNLNVSVIAYDVLFSESEENPIDSVIRKSNDVPLNEKLIRLRNKYNADAEFANIVTESDSVLGMLFEHKSTLKIGRLPDTIFTSSVPTHVLPAPSFDGYVASLPKLQQSALGNGFINSAPDSDGFVRYAMLLAKHSGQLYPSLALEVARLYTLSDTISVEAEKFDRGFSISGLKIGNELIPTDDFGRVAIPYRGKAFSFPYISASDVIDGDVDLQLFEQAIIFVGTSAVGHADLRTTPVGVQYPGVEVHANLLEGLIFPEILPRRPDWIDGAVVILLLFLGLLGTFTLPEIKLLGIGVYAFSVTSAFMSFNIYIWSQYYLDFPQIAIFLLLALQLLILGSFSFFDEHKQRVKIKSIFDQYVPPEHINEIIENPDAMSVSGDRRTMTVLFADIRDFTSISEKLDASELKELLNLYFSPITEIIFEHNGTIDKYVGDMVMAFWNAPLYVDNHQEQAVKCALKMQEKVKELRKSFYDNGIPAISIGVGINTGEMNVGVMGSIYRRAYTVLGDAVNLGSRLEGITKFYGVEILVSEQTKKHCSDVAFRPIDKVKVKGKLEPVTIFEPVGLFNDLTEQQIKDINLHKSAWNSYLEQSWSESLALFTTLNNSHPDEKLYLMFCSRINEIMELNLDENWDGSFEHVTK